MLSTETKRMLADNDWGVGTILVGRESVDDWWSESIIMLTYVSEQTLAAVALARRTCYHETWYPDGDEGSWSLDCRPWRAATADDLHAADISRHIAKMRDDYPVLANLAETQVDRVESGTEPQFDELARLRFDLEMTDGYIGNLWEVVFGPDKPSPTVAESFCVGPRRTALKRIMGICSLVEWPWLAAKKRVRPAAKDLPLGVKLEDDDG